MGIDTRDHSSTVQKPYTLSFKHKQWMRKELENSENADIIK